MRLLSGLRLSGGSQHAVERGRDAALESDQSNPITRAR